MGYRASIKNINSLCHLINGNTLSFIDQTYSSKEMYCTTISFLEDLIGRYSNHFYGDWSIDPMHLKKALTALEARKYRGENFNHEYASDHLAGEIHCLSESFSRCKIKAIILPSTQGSLLDTELSSPNLLNRLMQFHPDSSALIIQPTDIHIEETVAIIDVFKNFDIALNSMDEWPGVFLWDDSDAIFIPIETVSDVIDIFKQIKYQKQSIQYLKRNRKEKERYAYIFHLSDFHFGKPQSNRRLKRVAKILENQMSKNGDSSAYPIITGDMLDSPTKENNTTYDLFKELLVNTGFENPIQILGNHDVDPGGFLKRLTTQKSVIADLQSTRRVTLIDELKLGILKFNSNDGGVLAQGQIDEEQLAEMGNEIDSIDNIEQYTLIAILHHHPKTIKTPKWYVKDWYEKLLGTKGFEKSMKLNNSALFLNWIESRNIKYILHGHKHIPEVHKHNAIHIMAAGSMTGAVTHREQGHTYMSYNLIKYDLIRKKPVTCTIVAEEMVGAGTKNVIVQTLC